MSIKMLNHAWQTKCPTVACQLVFLALCDSANDHGKSDELTFQSVGYLARKTHLSERSVQRSIKALEDFGLIAISSRKGRSNIIHIVSEKVNQPTTDRTSTHNNVTPDRLSPRHNVTPDKLSEKEPSKCHHTPDIYDKNPRQVVTHNRKEPLKINKPPIPPKGGTASITFSKFLEQCKERGEEPIPADDGVFEYADMAGIDLEFLRYHWCEFRDRYRQTDKRYKDWRKTFRNSVRSNWFRVWYISADGTCGLTTQGRQIANMLSQGKTS